MASPTAPNSVVDDAAFALSLQLVADAEYAQSETKRMVISPRRTLATRGHRNAATQPSRNRQSAISQGLSENESNQIARSALLRRFSVPKLSSASRRRPKQPNPSRSLPPELTDGSSEPKANKSLIYVPCEINDRIVEMMVDTGASTSVISEPLAKKLNLEHRLNTKQRGIAVGVGSARILGRIEACPIKIAHVEFMLYFAVLESDDDMLILGVDQMRRFNCLVDLQRNKLVFGGKDGVEVDFFSEAC